jgi:hypothetical protein
MQVLCKRTNGFAETHCCVCGQGFVMFWERQSRSERLDAMKDIQKALRNQHRHHKGPEAHPGSPFLVPEWCGPAVEPETPLAENEPTLAR